MKLRERIRRFGASVWNGWPEKAYQRERYQQRLSVVQQHLARCLDAAASGPISILSLCAGDGRDVAGVLSSHPRRADVSAWLVEMDRNSVAAGIRRATDAGLNAQVTFRNEDATIFPTYRHIAPADIVLVCGVWGHVPAEEKAALVRAVASLCKVGGAVVWTRGILKGTSRFDEIDSLFVNSGWERGRVSRTPDETWVVATHHNRAPAIELPTDGRIFHFRKNAG